MAEVCNMPAVVLQRAARYSKEQKEAESCTRGLTQIGHQNEKAAIGAYFFNRLSISSNCLPMFSLK